MIDVAPDGKETEVVLRGDRDKAIHLVTTGLVWSVLSLATVAVAVGLVLTPRTW
jgi:hypothetical protein